MLGFCEYEEFVSAPNYEIQDRILVGVRGTPERDISLLGA